MNLNPIINYLILDILFNYSEQLVMEPERIWPDMDRFDSMKIFVRVAELNSFTKAAESLGLPKASVSMAIQQLETTMGSRLLQRTTRKVQMTQDGIAFFERCRDLLADIEEVESMFQRSSALVTGRVRVDMPTGVAKNLVIPRLPDFIAEYPGIELELSCTDRKVDLIREGFDFVIRVGGVGDSGLIARQSGAFALVNCASPSYLKKHGRPNSLNDLERHSLIHYVVNFGTKPHGFEYFDGAEYKTVKMRGRVAVNTADAYVACCLAGFGIIQVPLVGVRTHLEEGTLVEVLPSLRAEAMPVLLAYPHRRHLSKRVQLLMKWIESLLREYTK